MPYQEVGKIRKNLDIPKIPQKLASLIDTVLSHLRRALL